MTLAIAAASVRVHRLYYTQRWVPFRSEAGFAFLPTEEARLASWDAALRGLAFSPVGDFTAAIERAPGCPPPRRLVHRVWRSEDGRMLAVAVLTLIDLSGNGDPTGQIRPLSLFFLSQLASGVLRTHNTISRPIAPFPAEDRDQRLAGTDDALVLWRAHEDALPGSAEPIEDPLAFLESDHARVLAAQVRSGALVVDGSGLVRPTAWSTLAMMLWNNLCVTAEARTPARGALLTASLCAASALHATALAGRPVESLGPALLAPFPILTLVTAWLFPNAYASAVVLVGLSGAPLWLAHPIETNLWSGGAMLGGLSFGMGLASLRRRGARPSGSTAPWLAHARTFLFVGGLANAFGAYFVLQVPSEDATWLAVTTWGPRAATLLLLLGGPLLGLSALVATFLKPSTWFQLGQLVMITVTAGCLGTFLGHNRALEDAWRTGSSARVVVEALRQHHASAGRLPDRLDGLDVPRAGDGRSRGHSNTRSSTPKRGRSCSRRPRRSAASSGMASGSAPGAASSPLPFAPRGAPLSPEDPATRAPNRADRRNRRPAHPLAPPPVVVHIGRLHRAAVGDT